VGAKKERAEDWYKVKDGLGAGIVRQSNFLRRKKKDKNGNVIEDGADAGAGGKPSSAGGTGRGLHGGSVDAFGDMSLDASTSMVHSASVVSDRTDSPQRDKRALYEAELALRRGRIPKDKIKDYGPLVDATTGKVNTAALIASQGFSEKIPTAFGAAIPVKREFTKTVNYAAKKNNAFSMVRHVVFLALVPVLLRAACVHACAGTGACACACTTSFTSHTD